MSDLNLDFTLEQNFGFVVSDVARLMRKRFEQRAKVLGLTRAQWQLLAYLQRSEGINQSGLADLLELEPISVGRLVDRMAEAGWVERRPDPADRRANRLYMTDQARPVMAQLRALGAESRAEALAGLDDTERRTMLGILARIHDNLSGRNCRACARDAAAGVSVSRTAADLHLETAP